MVVCKRLERVTVRPLSEQFEQDSQRHLLRELGLRSVGDRVIRLDGAGEHERTQSGRAATTIGAADFQRVRQFVDDETFRPEVVQRPHLVPMRPNSVSLFVQNRLRP